MASQEFHQHLTGAVIGSGGGGEKASEAEKTEAKKKPSWRRDSPPSAARIVRKHGLTEPRFSPEKCLSKPQNPHHPLHALLGAGWT